MQVGEALDGAGNGDAAFQARDGRIHVVYTSDGRKVINHAVLTEAWIRGR